MSLHNINANLTENNSGNPPGRNFNIAGGSDCFIASSSTLTEVDFYRFIVNNVNEGIILINEKGEHLYHNLAAELIAGYTFEELKGKSLFDFIHPDDIESVRTIFEEVLSSPCKAILKQFRILIKTGNYIWIECTCKNMLNTDVSCVLINYRDISTRKIAELEVQHLNETLDQRVKERTEELEAANLELEAFTYSVSHDLRSPLRVVSGYARIIEKNYSHCIDDDGKALLQHIITEIRKMSELTDGLIAFSMAGKKQLETDVVDMRSLTETAYAELLENLASSTTIEINDLEPVSGDAKLLKQVIVNLLSNALKYTSKKQNGKVTIGCERKDNAVVYHIKDNGDGFDTAQVEKLFKPFSRLHSDGEFEGTGIGLSIVDRIVKRHGGKVWAHGSKGNGASFFFSLPVNN